MYSKETLINTLKARQRLLQQRDPVANANIIRKITRRLRMLED